MVLVLALVIGIWLVAGRDPGSGTGNVPEPTPTSTPTSVPSTPSASLSPDTGS